MLDAYGSAAKTPRDADYRNETCASTVQIALSASISEYEHGKREPNLLLLLSYARLANVAVEALIDDGLDLPQNSATASKIRMTD
jgi:DNA-binding XRE family transcriptional regulator